MKRFERWPGLEHLTIFEETKPLRAKIGLRLKIMDKKAEGKLNSLIKKIDQHSVMGEWGIRFCLISSILLFFLGFSVAALIPLIVLIGSVARYYMDKPNNEEEIYKAVFGDKKKK